MISAVLHTTQRLPLHQTMKKTPGPVSRAVYLFFKTLSPKQCVRPDSITSSIKESVPAIKRLLSVSIFRVAYVTKRIVGITANKQFKEDIEALKTLGIVEASSRENRQLEISADEKRSLVSFLTKIARAPEILLKLEDFLTISQQPKDVCRAFKSCRNLFNTETDNRVASLKIKLEVINQNLESSNPSGVQDCSKLDIRDFTMLCSARSSVKLLQTLRSLDVIFERQDELTLKWTQIDELGKHPTVESLRSLVLRDLKSGRIFFGHRYLCKQFAEEHPDFDTVMRNILIGSLNHVGIFTQKNREICLSHLGSVANRHTVKPLWDPLFFAFFRVIDLDISALLPNSVSPEHRLVLKNAFSESFERLSAIEHPNVTMDRRNPHLITFPLGHKSFFPKELSEVVIPPRQVGNCSTYVAEIFLMAIHEVNSKLKELGYSEQMDHPFGRHENLHRMDPLRLFYHWKKLGITKNVDRTLANFVHHQGNIPEVIQKLTVRARQNPGDQK